MKDVHFVPGKEDMRTRRGFSLVELLVVIGIIAVLISILLPSLSKARAQANFVKCQSNMRQIGIQLQMYLNDWNGWLFPPNLHAGLPENQRWTAQVFDVWNPPIMLCPSDLEPELQHSYLLNDHLVEHKIRANSTDLGGKSTSDVVVLGEKRTDYPDYYMNRNDYDTRVEPYRHGIQVGSNYLYMDWHVGPLRMKESLKAIDPWDVPPASSQPAP
jgi:prepilin-type N-terminal cleavage/methylation domain-containing protein/prepilin-type processing-associated H-X9-DG protein